MTRAQALQEARRRWGPTIRLTMLYALGRNPRRYQVWDYTGLHHVLRAEGESWEAAFTAADHSMALEHARQSPPEGAP